MRREADSWYVVSSDEILQDFLMTIVGGADHWLFLSSTGALTAGRTNAQQSLFSYETEDRLHRLAGESGPVTVLRVKTADGKEVVWRPWDPKNDASRTIAKRTLGDGVQFSETHPDLGVKFTYEWQFSDSLGFVRRCSIQVSDKAEAVEVKLVDGLAGLLPYGVDPYTQQTASVLVDAYKHSEIVEGRIGVYSLSSRIVDRPEPAEALRCSVAFQHGLDDATVFLDRSLLEDFERDGTTPVMQEIRLGKPSGYFVHTSHKLSAGQRLDWIIGADIGWEAERVIALQESLSAPGFVDRVNASVAANRLGLRRFVARADGLQTSNHSIRDDRHATNVMFNCMRGGVIATDQLSRRDVRDFIATRNGPLAREHSDVLGSLDDRFSRAELMDAVRQTGDLDLVRLASEYMPLTFSRRHGDPSRPWNTFSINIRNPDGSERYYYEGNWRDVFQNWEALLTSFPEYLESSWTVFLNATTADGHNPYRITRDGIDWERPDPDDPWAHIGYWGDHQIIYLLKLLELYEAHYPGQLQSRLNQRGFVYADVPYRIGSYEAIVADPHETITFDKDHDRVVDQRRESIGADGNLLHDGSYLVHASLAEKLVVTVLAKLANFVADGGIWMNTQRPEWNDANNALVGNGLSVVTLAYLVRHLNFLCELFDTDGDALLHEPVVVWLRETAAVFDAHEPSAETNPTARRKIMDGLGTAASSYRETLYTNGLGDEQSVELAELCDLVRSAHASLVVSLETSRRSDGMFHGYNLLALSEGEARVKHLPVMLEGQVAALSAGALAPAEAVDLVEALFEGPLYRQDQNTFLLYPDKVLPRFLERGIIPAETVASNEVLSRAVADSSCRLANEDRDGVYRFGGSYKNADDLAPELEQLRQNPSYTDIPPAHWDEVSDVWESVFEHYSYTGRSGSMYGYEGIGSVYWHMVSKLNLAMQEAALTAHARSEPADVLRDMAEGYYRLRAGLGDAKTFEEYGAFPTDAYSHTPPRGGARQPGMTGQVKEDILTRRGELGVVVRGGELRFEPVLLRASEFLEEATTWKGLRPDLTEIKINLQSGQIAFTVCQVPVVYTLVQGDEINVSVTGADGSRALAGDSLGRALSAELFARKPSYDRIDVEIGRARLLLD